MAPVPTPFHHLVMAESVRQSRKLAPAVREALDRSRPAFLLGHVAPDYVSLAGRPRTESHWFEVPMVDRRPAHLPLFQRHPELSDPERLDPDHAAFVAGYLAHLWVDQAWIAYIFEPAFGPAVARGTFEERLLDHNLLRAALDREDLARLPSGLDSVLQRAEPEGWLPFASDVDLRGWRDILVEQLRPGARPSTVEVFASRHGLAPEAFAARLSALEAGSRAAPGVVRPGRLEAFRRLADDMARTLTQGYLLGYLLTPGHWNAPFPRPQREPRPEKVVS